MWELFGNYQMNQTLLYDQAANNQDRIQLCSGNQALAQSFSFVFGPQHQREAGFVFLMDFFCFCVFVYVYLCLYWCFVGGTV